ncbi:MAG: flippase-like domain-containing protein, partial [Chloroflexota bacterium]
MTNPDKIQSGSSFKKTLPGLIVSLGAFIILFYLIDLDSFVNALRFADYSKLPIVIVLFLGTILARAIAWRTILQEKISFPRSFWTLNEGYLFNNILPFRLGEVARAFLLNKTNHIPFWEVISTIMIERIFDVAILAGVLLGTIPFVIGAEWAVQAANGGAVIVLIGFAVLYWLARNPGSALKLFRKLTRPWPKFTEIGQEKVYSFLKGLTALTSFRKFVTVLFWLLVTWGFNIAWYAILLEAFSPGVPLIGAVFTVGAIAVGVSAPSSPAYIGVFEAAAVGALVLFDVKPDVALAYA